MATHPITPEELAAIVMVPGSLVMCLWAIFSRDARRFLPGLLTLALVMVVTTVPSQYFAHGIWHAGFERLARKSSPLVAAIRKFESDRKRPPADLAELVKASYIAEIPATPCGCSEYRYTLNGRGNPWTLTVNPPFRGIGFDRFDYWPKQDYPVSDSGGRYERFGDWAYYHE